MRKVLLFSAFLVVGLFIAQYLPAWSGSDYGTVKTVSNVLLYICLGFIMINVGREFEVDKSRWQTYAKDYFVAMATAAMPWFLIAIYYIFVLLPPEYWNSWEAWKENLLLSRFAAPTSAGILFTMLAAIGLKSSWIYKKIQVLAIFDDLDILSKKIHGLLNLVSEEEEVDSQEALSQREKEIVICVVKGMTNKEIAENLFLSIHTVITHRRNISKKLQIHSAAGLTIYAIVNKLVTLNEVKDL